MKKLISILISLSLLLCVVPGMAEDVVAAAAGALSQCVTLDEQLAALDAQATDGAAVLDTPGWKGSLIVPLAEALPGDLLPGTDEAEGVDALPEALAGARYIAILQHHHRHGVLRGGEAVRLYSDSNDPPAMGVGSRLLAASIPIEEVWSAVRPFFQSVV